MRPSCDVLLAISAHFIASR